MTIPAVAMPDAATIGRIAAIETHHLTIPSEYGGPTPPGDRQLPFVQMLLVRVETDTGLVGWGEGFGHSACAATKVALDTLVAPLCIGEPAVPCDALLAGLVRRLHPYGVYGPVGFALSGIDIALWDIRGKAAGVPVHRLLGGAGADRVPAYASLLRYGDAHLVGEACRHAVARGHKQVKLHEATVETVHAARSAVGPEVALKLDVNCRWNPSEAAILARELSAYELSWIEEPCWPEDLTAYRAIAACGGAVAAGENAASAEELDRIAGSGAVAVLQPSAAKHGGLTALLRAQDIAHRHGVRLAPHSAYFGPALAATVQFCASTGIVCEWYDCRLEANPSGLLPVMGHLPVPSAPGLGLAIDPDTLRHYRMR